VLVLRFVDEFLAVRALGILCLLQRSRCSTRPSCVTKAAGLLITVFAYLLIVAGPVLGLDSVRPSRPNHWTARSVFRWRCLNAVAFIYGGVILAFAFTQY